VSRPCLKCIYANACSIVGKVAVLEAMACDYESDVIGITESWAHDGINDSEIALKSYDMFWCDRQVNTRSGRVLLYFNLLNMVWVQCK